MKLSIADRVTLLSILPEQGDFVTLKIVRKLREDLSFSEDEICQCEITADSQQVKWNSESDPMKDVAIGEKAEDLIVASLKKLNDEKTLSQQHFGLYEKFIEKSV